MLFSDETARLAGEVTKSLAPEAIPCSRMGELVILSNIGVQYCPIQIEAAAEVKANLAEDVGALLADLEAAMAVCDGPALFAYAPVAADLDLAGKLGKVLECVFNVAKFPLLAGWFQSCQSHPDCPKVRRRAGEGGSGSHGKMSAVVHPTLRTHHISTLTLFSHSSLSLSHTHTHTHTHTQHTTHTHSGWST